jgi:hypothetical protein
MACFVFVRPWPVDRASGRFQSPGFRVAKGLVEVQNGERDEGELGDVLTSVGDGWRWPDFGEGRLAVELGGSSGLHDGRRFEGQLATGAGVLDAARRCGPFGGDGLLRLHPWMMNRAMAGGRTGRQLARVCHW